MSWDDMDVWSFDTETTGTDVFEDRIITASLVRVSPDDSTLEREWVINPGYPVSDGARKAHGLSDEWIAEHGQDPAKTLPFIADAVRWVLNRHQPLAVQNAAFDLTLLEAELARYELEPIGLARMSTVLDPMVLTKYADKTLARPKRFVDPATGKGYVYRLPELCARFGVEFEETHQSSADAVGTARLTRALGKKEKQLTALPPEQLFNVQRTAHREGQRSFREWAKKLPEDDPRYGTYDIESIDGGWPLHTSLQAVHA